MPSERLHALDAARGFALLVGIVLHATMSFFIFIPAKDVSPSTTLALTFYVIHIFRMSLFYVMAGFFAHMVFHRKGARAFLKDRGKRIFVPMTVGWLLLAPPTIGIIIWGLTRSFPDAAAGAAPATAGFPLIHLWFLYYLCIFYALTLALRGGFVHWLDRAGLLRARIDRMLQGALAFRLLPAVLALPIVAVLFLDAAWPLWFGIPTPDHGFAPQLPAMVIYGSAFALGWLLHRQVGLLAVFEQRWRSNLVLAIGFTVAALAMVGPAPFAPAPASVAATAGMRLAYTACYALAVWFWTFGLIGAAMRWCAGKSAARRYLADSSYWLYLVHVPVVFGLQVLAADLPLHWAIKFPLILVITFAVLLLSYHYLVRATVIGEILNGRRYPRRLPHPHAGATPAVVDAAVTTTTELEPATMARLVGATKHYGKTAALAGLDLSVRAGELLAVLGPNGAGKTTAIDLWLGMRQADAGEVSLLGGSPLDVPSRLGVGVMLQDVDLAPQLSAREQIALAASYYRDPLGVDEVIALVGIQDFARKRYVKLSAGQKRQVQFAVALCGRPHLLFLDEPSVGLDIEAREALWRNIRRLVKEGCAVVLTTHYLEEAEALADRVAVVAHGKCIAAGSVEQMRALVERKRIRCASNLDLENIRLLPGVVDVARENDRVLITATDAESVVWQLMTADPALRHLEVSRASLADAFTALVKEAA